MVQSAAGILMFRRYVMVMMTCMMTVAGLASAQTPVEKVIIKYEDTEGARYFLAQGVKMAFARKLIQTTQMAPIASEVDELAVLKMENAPQYTRVKFVADLNDALKSYEHYGRYETKNGDVDIYILRSGPDSVEELVIYNPEIFSLNSLHGSFTVSQLLKLE